MGPEAGTYMGFSVSAAGDLDCEGVPDTVREPQRTRPSGQRIRPELSSDHRASHLYGSAPWFGGPTDWTPKMVAEFAAQLEAIR